MKLEKLDQFFQVAMGMLASLRSRFLDVTGGALRDIQKTAARETVGMPSRIIERITVVLK